VKAGLSEAKTELAAAERAVANYFQDVKSFAMAYDDSIDTLTTFTQGALKAFEDLEHLEPAKEEEVPPTPDKEEEMPSAVECNPAVTAEKPVALPIPAEAPVAFKPAEAQV